MGIFTTLAVLPGTMATAAASATVAAGLLARAKRSKVGRRSQVLHGIKFPYALQKDAYADLEFLNDVGFWAGDKLDIWGEDWCK